jgi:hypothetical protein
MSIYQEIGQRYIDVTTLDGVTVKGPTAGVWFGTAGTAVVVLASDPIAVETTFAGIYAGTWLPISIKKWVSGPANAVGIGV